MIARMTRLLAHPRAAASLVVLGLSLRVMVIVLLRATPLVDDAADYHHAAQLLRSGVAHEPEWPPGVPYFLALAQAVFGDAEIVSRFAILCWYPVLAYFTYAIAERLGQRVAGNLALAAMAVVPSFVVFSITPLTQLPTAALLVMAVYLAWVAEGFFGFVALGAVLGALVLVRPSNLLLALVVPLVLAVRARRAVPLLAWVIAAAMVTAWEVKATSLAGRFVFVNSANSQNLYYGNNPWTPLYRTWWFGSHKRGEPGVPDAFVEDHARLAALPAAQRDKAFSAAAVAHIKSRPDLFVVRSLSRTRAFFAFDTFAGAQLVKKGKRAKLGLLVLGADATAWIATASLALVALFSRPRSPDDRFRRVVLLGVALLYALPYFASFSHPTYHFPIAPLLLVLAAAVFARRADDGRFDVARRGWLIVALAALALVQVEWIVNMLDRA